MQDWLRSDHTLAAQLRNRLDMARKYLDGELGTDHDLLDSLSTEQRARNKMKSVAVENNLDWSTLFDYYDRDGQQELGLRDFKMALRRDAKIPLSVMDDVEIKQIFDMVDIDGGVRAAPPPPSLRHVVHIRQWCLPAALSTPRLRAVQPRKIQTAL
eukprot:COSAG05_NODE_1222_length_5472_cov_7.765033_5_plen_156_part_00